MKTCNNIWKSILLFFKHTETKLVLEAHAKMWFCRFVWWLVVLTFNTTSSLLVKPSSICHMLLCTAVHTETIIFWDFFRYAFNSSCPCKLVRIWQRFRLQCLKRLFSCMETRNPFWSSETNVVGRHWLLLLLATGSELTFSFSKSSPPFWIAFENLNFGTRGVCLNLWCKL